MLEVNPICPQVVSLETQGEDEKERVLAAFGAEAQLQLALGRDM